MFFGVLGGEILARLLGQPVETMSIAGMAAALAAVFNAPLGAILIVIEMTHLNYTGPVTLAAFISFMVARKANILVYSGYRNIEAWRE